MDFPEILWGDSLATQLPMLNYWFKGEKDDYRAKHQRQIW